MKSKHPDEDQPYPGVPIADNNTSSNDHEIPYHQRPTIVQIGTPFFAGTPALMQAYQPSFPLVPFFPPIFHQQPPMLFENHNPTRHYSNTTSSQINQEPQSHRRQSPRSRQQIPISSTQQPPMPPSAPKKMFRRQNVAVPPSSGIPVPTPAYNATSLINYKILEQPQHLLVIIDLNGTLLHRPSKASPTKFTSRPHTPRFLNYCINTFTVVIWSSARPENVQSMCSQILPPDLRASVVAIWGRDKFGLTVQEYNNKVQCYKRLSTIWNDKKIRGSHPDASRGRKWDQTNTVLIDDSLYKGKSEPFNLIEIPEFGGKEGEEEGVLPQVHDYLNRLSLCSNVSNHLRQHPFQYRTEAANRT